MCGIAGVIAHTVEAQKYLDAIHAATAAMDKRGPDQAGIFTDNQIALGHKRLSIIDTSSAAQQPFTDKSGKFTLVFNGEIYNYQSLKTALLAKGHTFISSSDTEVLLYHLIEFGVEDGIQNVDGEFAFAFFDHEQKQLHLVRDRFGVKPLYYFQDKVATCFASELKALTKFPFTKKLDKAALQAYFHLNYIPSPLSIYEGVKKLMPGCSMTINFDGSTSIRTYYAVPENNQSSLSFEQAKKQLRTLLESSVERRMVADVPLGTFLSGGIDSSIITAIASQQTNKLQSFSIGFADEPLFDETAYARLMANRLQTEHTVFSLRNSDLYAHLFDMLDYLDEPFADSSALAVYILSKETRKHVTVALSGDGADEIFAGYNKHAAELKIREKSLTNILLKQTQFILPYLPKSRNSSLGNRFRQLEKYVNGLRWSAPERYWQWARWAGLTEQGLLKPAFTDENAYQAIKQDCLKACNENFESVLRTDLRLVLENDMLVKTDRMSMANSLEMRVPFLDHAIVDFAFSLPTDYKINKVHRKHILKEAFADYLPQELFNRGKKGFEVPLLRWFQGELRSLIEDDLLSESFIQQQGIFNYSIIKAVKDKLYTNSPNDAVEQIWSLVVFQIWWKKQHSQLQ